MFTRGKDMRNIQIKLDDQCSAAAFNITMLEQLTSQIDTFIATADHLSYGYNMSGVINLIIPYYSDLIRMVLKRGFENGTFVTGKSGRKYQAPIERVYIIVNEKTRAVGVCMTLYSAEIEAGLKSGDIASKNDDSLQTCNDRAQYVNVVYARTEGIDGQFDVYSALPMDAWTPIEGRKVGGVLVC